LAGLLWLSLPGGHLVAADTEAAAPSDSAAADSTGRNTQRLLLLGQGPDRHAWSTHEYMAGVNILAKCLEDVDGLQTIIVRADEPFEQGPELLDGADGLVLFVSEGAKWLHQDEARLAAFQSLAARGKGLVVLHWGMGCRDAEYINGFVDLFGGCHGGSDRKHGIYQVRATVDAPNHPIMRGIDSFDVEDEFYYRLKFPKSAEGLTSLLRVPVMGEEHTVAWAWERPNGGRSAGFSGCHFHRNWELEEYRRLATQAVLWSLKRPIPEAGLPVDVAKEILYLPPREEE
jgi:type 1 glutamine amidotransferase